MWPNLDELFGMARFSFFSNLHTKNSISTFTRSSRAVIFRIIIIKCRVYKLSIVWNFILTLDMSRPLVQVLSFYNLGDFMFRCGLLLPDSIIIFRGVAYYVILPRQGVWGCLKPVGYRGKAPVGGFWWAKPSISDVEQLRVYLGPVLLQNSHKNMSQLYTIVHS